MLGTRMLLWLAEKSAIWPATEDTCPSGRWRPLALSWREGSRARCTRVKVDMIDNGTSGQPSGSCLGTPMLVGTGGLRRARVPLGSHLHTHVKKERADAHQ